jgi:hypothetical protein
MKTEKRLQEFISSKSLLHYSNGWGNKWYYTIQHPHNEWMSLEVVYLVVGSEMVFRFGRLNYDSGQDKTEDLIELDNLIKRFMNG